MNRIQLQSLFGEKGEELCKRLFSFQVRFPKFFPRTIGRDLGRLLSCSDEFLESHDVLLLRKLLFSHHRLLKQCNKTPSSQRIYSKILEIHPSVYGITIALSSLQEHETFHEKHIIKGIQNLIPGIKPLPHSFLSFQCGTAHLFYLKIKKMRGGIFSHDEKTKLSSELNFELRKEIESNAPQLFFPGNEEELFKKIRDLSLEIKSAHDLPQVMITFSEYNQETLKFLVIVLRVLKPETPSVVKLSSHLPSLVHFSLENAFPIDMVRKKYQKEATIFTLEVNSSLFNGSPRGVNLRTARQYIVRALEGMFGPLRDYNGGLLNKENEQLVAIKRMVEKKGGSMPFLEDLFYGIKPIAMRVLISMETAVALTSLFKKMIPLQIDKNKRYILETTIDQEAEVVIIKTDEKEWKHSLTQRILAHSFQIGSTFLEYEGHLYLFFFQQHHQYPDLLEAVQRELANYQLQPLGQTKTILHINFQGGDPSSLNPRLASDIHSHLLSNLLFEGLTQLNHEGQVELALAEKIEISPSGLHYTFHLRPAWWSNGDEVTAYHFERSWKKTIVTNTQGALRADFFSPIKNANNAREKMVSSDQIGIFAKNAKTLCVELDTPCPYFLNLVSTPPFFPLLGEAEEPTAFNGPFTLAKWERDSSLYLSQNPFYREAHKVRLGGIKISMIHDPYIAYEMYQKGELDIIGDPISPLPLEIIKRLDIQKEVLNKPASRIFWIHCNTHLSPLHNADLRRALYFAINRDRLAENVFVKQIPHLSPLPEKYSQYQGDTKGNPKRARLYFKRALKALNITQEEFPSLTMTHSDLSFEKPLMEELKAQWLETLGITVSSQQLSWSEFSSALDKGNFQLAGLFRRDFFNHFMFYLGFFKTSPCNPHAWENQEYENLFRELYEGRNQKENLKQIESLLIKEAPVIPLINQRYLMLINKRVKGLKWNENGCLDLKGIWIDEEIY